MSMERVAILPGALVLLAALSPASADAQSTPTFRTSVTESSELVSQVGTTHRVGRADIEEHNARTLDEALRLVPGVYVRTGGDGTPRIDIRGFRSRHVLLLIDGVPANSTSDGQFDPARISTAAIREITIGYSSSSLLYGDNALAAVIEITTLDGQADMSLELAAGTSDRTSVAGRIARSRGPWSITATTTAASADAFRLPGSFVPTAAEDGHRRENSDRDRGDLRATVGYRVTPSVSIRSAWSLTGGHFGLPPSTVIDPADQFAQLARYERVEDYRTTSGQVSVGVTTWRRVDLRGWAYLNQQREDRSRYDDATYSSMDDPQVPGTFQSREWTTVSGATALGRVNLGRTGWLRLAVNQRREAFEGSGTIRDVPAASGSGGGGGRGGGTGRPSAPQAYDVRAFLLDRHVDVASTGAEWQARPAAKVGTVLGAALNWQRRVGAGDGVSPTWIAGVSYDATTDLRFHASATRKIRVPSIDQLYSTTAGNQALKTEQAYGLDVGVDRRAGRASVGVAGFVTRAVDFIERTGGAPFDNQGVYRFAGAELTVQTPVVAGLALTGTYSFIDSVNVTDGASDRRLQTRPRHRGSVAWTWRPTKATSVRGVVQLVGPQLFDSRGTQPVQMQADGYAMVDVGLSQTVGRRYEIVLDVTNLFAQLYSQAYGLPREGRMALLALRARFN